MGVVKEKLEAEWELVKFMGQEENTELREKMEVRLGVTTSCNVSFFRSEKNSAHGYR